ncbi:MAG: DUF2461 domain-containing protein [Bacteroidia bacterium]|nr:DUF2461 domain-containing protein [Bacteroidia bacterium]
MQYLTEKYKEFFKELAANNNSEWFNNNRKRYENDVKAPFYKLVADVLSEFSKIDKNLSETKFSDCIFRINRDIRFSKDKTPYKLQMSAAIAPGGRKNMSYPGFYFEINPIDINIYSGIYLADKNQLEAIRKHISANLPLFEKLINSSDFIEKFNGEILGEKQKRIDSKYKTAAQKQAIIFNKQFYFKKTLDEKFITKNNLPAIYKEYYNTSTPICNFLYKAIKNGSK